MATKPGNWGNHKGFVDHIIREVLQRPKAETVVTAVPPMLAEAERPNYQRQKSRERLLEPMAALTKSLPAMTAGGEGWLAPDPVKSMGNPAAGIIAVPSSLPTGTLMALSMKPADGKTVAPATQSPAEPKMVRRQTERKQPDRGSPSRTRTGGQSQTIGVAAGYTIGYVIPNLDKELRQQLTTDATRQAVGVLSSRQGAAAHIMAADEAVKKTSAKLLRMDLARDDNGGSGHGALVLLGSPDVADAVKAVEIALAAVDEHQENISSGPAGKIETHFSARSAAALEMVFGIAPNQAVGILVGAPAGIGLLMSDTALKTAKVAVAALRGPSVEQAFANEVWLVITGEAAAVRNALDAGRQAGEIALAHLVR